MGSKRKAANFDPRRLARELIRDGGWRFDEIARLCDLTIPEVEALAVEAEVAAEGKYEAAPTAWDI